MDGAAVAVLPICYEWSPSYGCGSGEGPYHLLDASIQLERIDEETGVDWAAGGIHTLAPLVPPWENPRAAMERIERAAGSILAKGKALLSLGGDHAVSIGLIRAVSRVYPDVGVLQVDAHLDLRSTWNGSPYNHACVMRRVTDDMGLELVQVGIRAVSREEQALLRDRGYRPFFAHDTVAWDDTWIDEAIQRLPEKVYLTLDLDGLDPSVIPGTGTPEPGGLSYRQVLRLIRRLGAARRVVAADINELAVTGQDRVSEFTAARLAEKICVHCLG